MEKSHSEEWLIFIGGEKMADRGVRLSSWTYGIPSFNIQSLFTYFTSLNETAQNAYNVAIMKKHLYERATARANTEGAVLSNPMLNYEKTALDFLL